MSRPDPEFDRVRAMAEAIRRGADVNRKDPDGRYPVHAVVEWDRAAEILEALLTHGADATLTYQNHTAMDLAIVSRSSTMSQPR